MGERPSSGEDERLVEQSLKGDLAASRELFQKHRERVYRLAYRYLGDREDALDATQQAFINAFSSLAGFAKQSSFYTWLARITVNAAIDLRRRRQRYPVRPEESAALDAGRRQRRRPRLNPQQQAQQHELQEALRRAVASLPEPQQQVFALHTYEQMTYKQIAEALGCSIGTVMSRLFYARKRLQKMLGPYL